MLAANTQMNEDDAIEAFLAQAGWSGASYSHLAGDASFRRYKRVEKDGRIAVLMDATRDKRESDPHYAGYTPVTYLAADLRPFIHVTRLLTDHGISAPGIMAEDAETGFLLLEDLGDHSYTKWLRANPMDEQTLYVHAADVLLHLLQLDKAQLTRFPRYAGQVFLTEASLLADWFLPQVVGLREVGELKKEYLAIWQAIIARTPLKYNTLVLRDYHADNLMWLPQRDGYKRVGQLDYQDALLGDIAYDMVSFLQDARREVSPQTVKAVVKHYLNQSGDEEAEFNARYAVLGAQRNAKIVGIFTRLYVRDNKANYLDYLPRVWRLLEQDLEHPIMVPMREWMDRHIPASMRGTYRPKAGIRSLI